MCNRFRIAKEIEEANPGVMVEHKCYCPLSTKVSVGEQAGEHNCPTLAFMCPSCIPLCNEEKTAEQAKGLLGAGAGAQDMQR
jgi:hypothetical protein